MYLFGLILCFLLLFVMNQKQLLFLFLSVFIGIHFSLKVLYQFFQWREESKIMPYVYYYIVPQFHFNYKVFAPEPPLAREFFVYRGILKDSSKTLWFEDGNAILQKAYENRFSVHYKRWKIVNYLGFQCNSVYVQLLQNPSIQHLGEDKVKEIANQQIVYYPQYKNACNYAHQKLIDKGYFDLLAVEVAYLRKPVSLNQNDTLVSQVQKFPLFKVTQ